MKGAISSRGNRILVFIAITVATSLTLVSLAGLNPSIVFRGEFFPGLMNGTEWGQVSIAAAWCVLGPFSLARRLPVAAGWLAAVIFANGISVASDLGWRGDLLLIFAVEMLLHWVFVQVLIWPFVFAFGLHISHVEEANTEHRVNHFGIRELLILIFIVAIVLGIGRLTLRGFTLNSFLRNHREIKQTIVIAGLNALIAIPLIVAGVTRNRVALASVAAVTFALIASVVTVSLLTMARGLPADLGDYVYWFWTNFVQSVWILAVLFALRAGGYRLILQRDNGS